MAAVIGSLRAELSATVAKFEQDMGRAANAVRDVARDMTLVGTDFKRTGAQLQSIGTSLTKTVTLSLVGLGVAVAKVGIDFESSFAGVRKTVAGVVDNLGELTPVGKRLQQEFRDLAKIIPVSVNELNRLGEAAGALGIPTQAVTEFARVMAELGVTTNLTSDQAAESIAKIQNIFGAAGKDTDRFASTLVALGNAGASTEVEIVEMAKRLAGAGHTIGLTQGQVLGFASALSSVGVEAEAGGTAISKVFIKLAQAVATGGKDLSDFAQIAGVSGETFAAAFRDDAALATTSFVEGLGRIQASGGNLFGTLERLELGEVRVRDALLRAVGAGDLFRASLTLQNTAWQENTALTIEAQQRYKTTASQLRLLRTRIEDVGITIFNSLKPAIDTALVAMNGLVPVAESLAKAFSSLPGGVQLAVIGVAAFAALLGPVIFIAGQLVTSLGVLTLAFGKGGVATRVLIGGVTLVQTALGALRSVVLVNGALMFEWGKSTIVIGGWVSRLAGTIVTLISTGLGPLATGLRAVVVVFGTLLNPVALTIAAIVAVGLAIAALTGHWDDVKAAVRLTIQVFKDFGTILAFVGGSIIRDVLIWIADLTRAIGSGFVQGLQAAVAWLGRLASAIAGPVITAFREWGTWLRDQVPAWMDRLDDKMRAFGAATKKIVVEGAKDLHAYAQAIREVGDQVTDMIAKLPKAKASFFDDRALPQIMDVDQALALLKAQLAGTKPAADAFKSSVQAALAELAAAKDPAKEAAQAILAFRDAVESLVAKFSGGGLLTVAKQYEAALKKLGGTSNLTSAEIDELTDAFEAVIAKYKLLGPAGRAVVQHFEALRASLRPIPQVVRDLERGFDGLEDAIKDFGTTFRPTMADVPLASHDLIALTGELLRVQRATQEWIDTLSDVGIQTDEMSGSLRLTTADLRLFRQEGQRAFDLDSNVHALAESFARLAQISGESFGGIVQDIAQVIAALDLANQSIKQFTKQGATTGDKISAIAGGIAAVAQATSTGNKASSIAGGAVTGAKLGASIGSVVPVIGTAFGAAFGAIGGALVGYFRSRGPEWKKLAKDIGRDLGVNISSQFAKEMEAQSKQVGRQITETMNIARIAMEGGGLDSTNIDKFTGKLRDTFVFIGQGSLTAAQGAKVLDENFQVFADHFLQKGGLISKELQEIIRLNDEWGTHSKAIGEFIKGQIESQILPGLKAFTDASVGAREKLKDLQEQAKTATGDNLVKITEQIKTQTGIIAATMVTTQGAADGLAASVAIAFGELQKAGVPIVQIVDQLEPVVAALQAQFDAAGLSGGAAFDNIRATMALAKDEIAGPALQAVAGLGLALTGLHNTALLDKETFLGLSGQITSTFDSLIAQGFDGNRVLGLMREPLQVIWQLAKDFGFEVDEGTQALLDQAEGAGLVGEKMKPVQEQMLEANKRIATAVEKLVELFDKTLPSAAERGARTIRGHFANLRIDIPYRFNAENSIETPAGAASPPRFGAGLNFQHGSGGIRDFGAAGTWAMLHGREAVITEEQLVGLLAGQDRPDGEKTLTIENHFHIEGDVSELSTDRIRQKVAPEVVEAIRLNINDVATRLFSL